MVDIPDDLTLEEPTNDNNSLHVVRMNYRKLTELEIQDMQNIKALGAEFLDELDALGSGRSLSIAKTKIEEAVMWATKHITE